MKLLNKIRNKKSAQQHIELFLEQVYLKQEIAETTIAGLTFLHPDKTEEEIVFAYLNTIIGLVDETALTKFRDDVVSKADNKVVEVKELYSLFLQGEQNDYN